MKRNIIRTLIVGAFLFGSVSFSDAGDKKTLKSARGDYAGSFGGGYTIDTSSVGGQVDYYPLQGVPVSLSLPRGKGKGQAEFSIADNPFVFVFNVYSVKVSKNGKRVRFIGTGSVTDNISNIHALGTININAKKKRSGWTLSAKQSLSGSFKGFPMTVDSTISAAKN